MKTYRLGIRCYFPGVGNYTHHMQEMPLKDIAKWVEAYQFTHPTVESFTIKMEGYHRSAEGKHPKM
jgi:hypothetical protein